MGVFILTDLNPQHAVFFVSPQFCIALKSEECWTISVGPRRTLSIYCIHLYTLSLLFVQHFLGTRSGKLRMINLNKGFNWIYFQLFCFITQVRNLRVRIRLPIYFHPRSIPLDSIPLEPHRYLLIRKGFNWNQSAFNWFSFSTQKKSIRTIKDSNSCQSTFNWFSFKGEMKSKDKKGFISICFQWLS